jgi:hypothetical protein
MNFFYFFPLRKDTASARQRQTPECVPASIQTVAGTKDFLMMESRDPVEDSGKEGSEEMA